MTTIVETKPAQSGSGTTPMKRHVIRRLPSGGFSDDTLCGIPWDRLHPVTGEYCAECLEIYGELRPGWRLPRA